MKKKKSGTLVLASQVYTMITSYTFSVLFKLGYFLLFLLMFIYCSEELQKVAKGWEKKRELERLRKEDKKIEVSGI